MNDLKICRTCTWCMKDSTGQYFCCNENSPENDKGVSETQEGCDLWEKE